jgi:hypothetical protein
MARRRSPERTAAIARQIVGGRRRSPVVRGRWSRAICMPLNRWVAIQSDREAGPRCAGGAAHAMRLTTRSVCRTSRAAHGCRYRPRDRSHARRTRARRAGANIARAAHGSNSDALSPIVPRIIQLFQIFPVFVRRWGNAWVTNDAGRVRRHRSSLASGCRASRHVHAAIAPASAAAAWPDSNGRQSIPELGPRADGRAAGG